jgi:hypothetical protein
MKVSFLTIGGATLMPAGFVHASTPRRQSTAAKPNCEEDTTASSRRTAGPPTVNRGSDGRVGIVMMRVGVTRGSSASAAHGSEFAPVALEPAFEPLAFEPLEPEPLTFEPLVFEPFAVELASSTCAVGATSIVSLLLHATRAQMQATAVRATPCSRG